MARNEEKRASTKETRREFLTRAGTAAAGSMAFGVLLQPRRDPNAAQTVTMGIYTDPLTLDPGATGVAETAMIDFTMFDPLVWWLPNSKGGHSFYPGLATSYTVAPDATTYTFKLRQDVTFHDGTHFDATAVKATLDHIVDPATKSRSAVASLGPYKGTNIVDQYTAEVQFTQPNASFLYEMTSVIFGMASPTALEKYPGTAFADHLVGTGPFQFVEYVPDSHTTVKRNPNYKWGPTAFFRSPGPAKLESITFRVIPDATARYNAMQAGQADMAMNLDPTAIKSISGSSNLVNYNVPATGTPYGFPMNVKKTPTDDLRVRQAILHAVNQNELVKSVELSSVTAAHNVLTPSTPGYNPAASQLYPYDLKKAGQLLDAAGWHTTSNGTREKDGQKLTLDFLLITAAGFDLATEFFISELQKVGFTSTASDMGATAAYVAFNQGVQNFADFYYYDLDPSLLGLWTACDQIQSGFNWGHYCNPTVDQMISSANADANPTTRLKTFQNVGKILMDDAVYLPMWDNNGAYGAKKSLKGLKFTPNGYALFHQATNQ